MHERLKRAALLAFVIMGSITGPCGAMTEGNESKAGDSGGTIQDAIGDSVGDASSPALNLPEPDILVVNAFTNGTSLSVEIITDIDLSARNGTLISIDADQNPATGNSETFEQNCPDAPDTGAEFFITGNGTIYDDSFVDTGHDAVVDYDGNRATFTASLVDVGITDGRANIQANVRTDSFPRFSSDCGPDSKAVEANSAQTADYQFQGNLSSRTLNAPDATDTGTGRGFGVETVLGAFRQVRTFSAGNGLRVGPTAGLIADSVYTIQMQVRISDMTGGGSGFVKLVDFSDQIDDRGLYAIFAEGNPTITYFDAEDGGADGLPAALAADEWAQIVMTRDADRKITGYINGVQQFVYTAAPGATDVSGPLVFFDDDTATGGNEVSGGAVACLRIYPTALDGAEVAELDCEPLRVGLNGNACAYANIGEAIAAAQSGDGVIIEVGHYNERIGLIQNKNLQLGAGKIGSNCTLVEPEGGDRVVVDGTGFTNSVGVGGLLDIRSSSVILEGIDLTNGTTGQGGLVYIENGNITISESTLSNGTASSDLVDIASPASTGNPAGGCIHAENSQVGYGFVTFVNCRVIGPNNGGDAVDGNGGAIHARAQSLVVGFALDAFTENSARRGGAIWAFESTVTLGSSRFERNTASAGGGAIGIFEGGLEITDRNEFNFNSAGTRGGAIDVILGDLAIRPGNEFGPTRFNGNFAQDIGGAISINSNSDLLGGPTIQGAEFFDNDSAFLGGAIGLTGAEVEIVDSSFIANSANIGGAILSESSTSIIRSSSACKAFQFDDPNEYCSQFINNFADFGSAVVYGPGSERSHLLTTAFVENSGPDAVRIGGGQGSPAVDVSMESVWFHNNGGHAILSQGDSALQLHHATFEANAGSAYAGRGNASLGVFNSIAFGNSGGGFSSTGSGMLDSGCNIDQSDVVGPNVDPLFVDTGDGNSHLDPQSPAVDACADLAELAFDLEGRPRLQGLAPDMGAFETSDVLFASGFELPALR